MVQMRCMDVVVLDGLVAVKFLGVGQMWLSVQDVLLLVELMGVQVWMDMVAVGVHQTSME